MLPVALFPDLMEMCNGDGYFGVTRPYALPRA